MIDCYVCVPLKNHSIEKAACLYVVYEVISTGLRTVQCSSMNTVMGPHSTAVASVYTHTHTHTHFFYYPKQRGTLHSRPVTVEKFAFITNDSLSFNPDINEDLYKIYIWYVYLQNGIKVVST